MIDTLKIITNISEAIYKIISENSNIKVMYNKSTGEIFYEIINDSLEGTYDSRLSVRCSRGSSYGFGFGFTLSIEGSYHKIIKGQNAYDGFYNLQQISLGFIRLVENAYNIVLPDLKHWFLMRVDITKSFDLFEQNQVCKYINSLKFCSYPRRNVKFYENETLYVSGDDSTIKIYNKYLEFNKNDKSKVCRYIDIFDFLNKIKGYVRFECEIKKRKLTRIFNKKFIRVNQINYNDLVKIWSDEFMKLLKVDKNVIELKRVRTKEDVKNRLSTLYSPCKALRLYQFFITILNDGYNTIKQDLPSTSFYRNISDLKNAGIDFTQTNFDNIQIVNFDEIIDFDPFCWKEVV